jgi:hypothetical protein
MHASMYVCMYICSSSSLGIPMSWVLRTHGIEEILAAGLDMVRDEE